MPQIANMHDVRKINHRDAEKDEGLVEFDVTGAVGRWIRNSVGPIPQNLGIRKCDSSKKLTYFYKMTCQVDIIVFVDINLSFCLKHNHQFNVNQSK